MGAFSKFVKMLSPRNGRLIRESGELVNEADLLFRQDSVNYPLAVQDGIVFTSFWDGTIASGATVTFHQAVPENRLLRGISLSGAFNGSIEFKEFIGATAGTVLETLPSINANTDPELLPCQAVIERVDDITGGTQIEQSFGINPSTGAGSISAPLTNVGLGRIFYETTSPSFQFTNFGNQDCRLALSWAWKRCCTIE